MTFNEVRKKFSQPNAEIYFLKITSELTLVITNVQCNVRVYVLREPQKPFQHYSKLHVCREGFLYKVALNPVVK